MSSFRLIIKSPAAAVAALLASGAMLAGGAGCTASGEDVRPPADQLFFPTGMAASPDGNFLFIASANSELRYDSGTISAIDLDAVDDAIATPPDGCRRDQAASETLICDEGRFIVPGASVRTGNFATSIGVQDLGGGAARLLVPVRGDPSVTWMDWDPAARRLACADGEFSLCDEAHRLIRLRNDEDLAGLTDEPFEIFVDSANQYAMLTHLVAGAVTLIDTPADGAPILADSLSALFAPDPSTGVRGAVGVAGRQPGRDGDLLYVTSRTDARIQMLTVYRSPQPDEPLPVLLPTDFFFLTSVGGEQFGQVTDSRGIAFDATGDRAFVVSREPPVLSVYDTRDELTGTPANDLLAATDICREASSIGVADLGAGERVFITCFSDGQVYVVDPRAGAEVEAVTTVGRGPFGLVVSTQRQKLYVANLLEDTVAVVDLAPGPTQYRVVLQIGEVRE